MSSPNKQATVISAARISEAFDSGASFLETPEYRLGLARREGPGEAEIHALDTDIFHVFEGEAVLVSEGTLLEPRGLGPGEVRGTGIEDGVEQAVRKGDVIVIPRGVPHWFREVTVSPFIYLVVKSTKG
jgi:uncharacterized cupin superfamily protein